MITLALDANLIDGTRDAARDATIETARAFGFGGSSWDVARPSGGGTAARVLVDQDDPVSALCYRARPSAVVPVAGGTPVLDEQWRVIVLAGDVQAGDVLTSRADAAYTVRVVSLEGWFEYRRGEIEERR